VPLTRFQNIAERRLLEVLRDVGVEVVERRVQGESEMYVRIRLLRPPVDLFIYDDEAGIQGSGVDLQFETPDYSGPEELICSFLAEVRGLAEDNSHA